MRAASMFARWRAHPFVRGVLALQVGSLALTGVGFLASVVLARTLGPVGYGAYGWVMSTGTTIGLLRRLGQDYSATTRLAEASAAADPDLARRALVFYVFMSVATSVVLLPLAMLGAPWLTVGFADPLDMTLALRLYLVQGFWAVLAGLLVIALQGIRALRQLVLFETGTTLLGYALPVAAALAGYGVVGVFWGQVAGSLVGAAVGALCYAVLARRADLLPSPATLVAGVFRPRLDVAAETRYGLSIAVDKNLVSLYNLLPVLVLGLVAAESAVGELRVGMAYMAIPAVALSPISRLLMVDIPRLRVEAPDRVRSAFLRVTRLALLASIAIALPFVLLGWLVIPQIYGQAYALAAPLVLVLALDAATIGMGVAAGPVFRTYNRTDLPIVASVAILALGLPTTWMLASAWGSYGAALAYGGMMLASRLVAYIQCLRVIPR
ncbi:MAG: oligosaccharide flippase family protein [Chloroflexota bacterium]